MRSLMISALVLILVPFAGCTDEEHPFLGGGSCVNSRDCPDRQTCDNGTCVATSDRDGRGDGTGGTGDGTNPGADAGTTPTADAGGNPALDVSVQDGGSCTPNCAGRTCGDDGCGGSCGDCGIGQSCVAGVCQGGGTSTGIDCVDIIECIHPCTDQACFTNCIGQGTPEAQSLFNAIIECIQTRCADVDPADEPAMIECQNTQCSAEITACTGTEPPGTGDASCSEVVECLLGCPDQECGNACIGTGTAAAQGAAIDFYNCGVENCADATSVDQFMSCDQSACSAEYAACGF